MCLKSWEIWWSFCAQAMAVRPFRCLPQQYDFDFQYPVRWEVKASQALQDIESQSHIAEASI